MVARDSWFYNDAAPPELPGHAPDGDWRQRWKPLMQLQPLAFPLPVRTHGKDEHIRVKDFEAEIETFTLLL